jgi:Ca-activated chloride channel homolog
MHSIAREFISKGFKASLALTLFCIGFVAWIGCDRPAGRSFRIIAGSGNATFEPILKRFGKENGVEIKIDYKGSLDIMQLLQSGHLDYDAVWDADSLWVSIGDEKHLIKNRESVMRSPVVFGVKKGIAQKLGWVDREVSVQDILNQAEKEKLRVMMTSATQSNSGASAYFGFLYAFAGNPDMLTAASLKDPAIAKNVTRLLRTVERTSESSGWLRDLFLKEYADYDAMFNYESHIIELNQALVKQDKEPLYIIYPRPGLGIADFPLSYVDHKDAEKEKIFLELQKYILSADAQKEIAAKGRRVSLVGMTPDRVDKAVFNPDWGVDIAKGVNPLRLPSAPVILQALNLYQTKFRKPSFTIYLLDFSGSMEGKGAQQLKAAMRSLLDQQEAGKYLLQGSPEDMTLVVIFDDRIINQEEIKNWFVAGNDAAAMSGLLSKIDAQTPRGGTNIYLPVGYALEYMKQKGVGGRFPAIILMTDGESNSGSLEDVKSAMQRTGIGNVPVYGITFGDASTAQLKALADLTRGRVFDGTKDLHEAFLKAKGNN